MYHNQEIVHSGETGDGVCFIINGIVKVAFTEATNMQDYFLGSGQSSALSTALLKCNLELLLSA